MIYIREISTNKELKEFIKFPFNLYKENMNWIPPLISDELNTLRKDRNPAFDYCEAKYWMAFDDTDKPLGRIAAIINYRYIEKNMIKSARFGWMDFVDNSEVAHKLLEQAELWAGAKGMDFIHGPLGFTDMDKEGLLVDGFDYESVFIAIYNNKYYPKYIENYGFVKDVDWIEYSMSREGNYNKKIIELANKIIKKYNLEILKLHKIKDIKPYATDIMNVLNEAYKDLYGVIPLSNEQIKAYIKQYLLMLNPDFVKVVLDAKGKVVAFVIAIPSLTKAFQYANGKLLPFGWYHLYRALKKNEAIDICLIGVHPSMQRKGLNAILFAELIKTCFEKGIKYANTFPILENNHKVHEFCEYFNAIPTKRRRCYIKPVSDRFKSAN